MGDLLAIHESVSPSFVNKISCFPRPAGFDWQKGILQSLGIFSWEKKTRDETVFRLKNEAMEEKIFIREKCAMSWR